MCLRVTPFVAGLLAIAAAAPLAAQLRASRPQRPTVNLPRLMVANPHSFQAADSAASVRVGAGMREKLENLAEKWYSVVQRNQMNDALVQYAYPMDAVLPPPGDGQVEEWSAWPFLRVQLPTSEVENTATLRSLSMSEVSVWSPAA